MDPLLPGDPAAIGEYLLQLRLGSGASGTAYLSQGVAVKRLGSLSSAGPELRSRMARECKALRGLSAPAAVPVLAADAEAAVPWFAAPYMPGQPLTLAVPAGGLDPAVVRQYGAQLCDGLAAVHAAGALHRALEPGNVVLGPDGPVVVDYGMAVPGEAGVEPLLSGRQLLATLAWAAPEVLDGGACDERSDVFGLGMVLGFLALGRNPFGAGQPEAVLQRRTRGGPDLARLDPFLRGVIEAALQPDPADRPTVAELRTALTTGTPIPGTTHRRWTPLSTALAVLAVAAVLGAAALAALWSEGSPSSGASASASPSAASPEQITVAVSAGCPVFACVVQLWNQDLGLQQESAVPQSGGRVSFDLPTGAAPGTIVSISYTDPEGVPRSAVVAMRPEGIGVGQPVGRAEYDAMMAAYVCWLPGPDGTGTDLDVVLGEQPATGGPNPIAWASVGQPTTGATTPTAQLEVPDGPFEEWGPAMC